MGRALGDGGRKEGGWRWGLAFTVGCPCGPSQGPACLSEMTGPKPHGSHVVDGVVPFTVREGTSMHTIPQS